MFLARVRQLAGGRPLVVAVWLMCLAMLALDVFTSPGASALQITAWGLLTAGAALATQGTWVGCLVEVGGLVLALAIGSGQGGRPSTPRWWRWLFW